MDFSYNKGLAPIAIEKIEILGAISELPAKQHLHFSPLTAKLGQMGLTGSLAEIHCYLSALKSRHNNLFLSGVYSL